MKEPEFFVSKAVTSLQTMLRVIAESDGSMPSVVPDGIYGADTMRAVTAYQRQNGLPVTGVTDYQTWQSIRNTYEDAIVSIGAAEPLLIILQPNQVFLRGSRNRHVLLLQTMLAVVSTEYENLSVPETTGVFDEGTETAVKKLQVAAGMKPSGIFDKQLYKLLTGFYRLNVGDGEKTGQQVQHTAVGTADRNGLQEND